LQRFEQVVGGPEAFAVNPPHRLQQPAELRDGIPVNPELARVGAAFGANRGCLEPDELGSTRGESLVAAPGQFARPSVRVAVATLHRVQQDRVADGNRSGNHLPREQLATRPGLSSNTCRAPNDSAAWRDP
jgi:hypothetical protein